MTDREVITREEARRRGFSEYFTGRPCKHGHVATRRTSCGICLACDEHRRRDPRYLGIVAEWREKNRDSIAQQRRGHYEKNRADIVASVAAYHKNNKEAVRGYKARYRRKHADKVKAYNSQWKKENRDRVYRQRAEAYRRNPEKHRKLARDWAAANPEYRRVQGRLKRARAAAASGSHTAGDVAEIIQLQKNKCAYCGVRLGQTIRHVDHIVPLARGGTNDRRNLQVLCQPCNNSKHAKDPIVFARQLGRLL